MDRGRTGRRSWDLPAAIMSTWLESAIGNALDSSQRRVVWRYEESRHKSIPTDGAYEHYSAAVNCSILRQDGRNTVSATGLREPEAIRREDTRSRMQTRHSACMFSIILGTLRQVCKLWYISEKRFHPPIPVRFCSHAISLNVSKFR